jgi:NAD(P)-dependent dehydrogenase (short-subunit alcohol dehydrogenase family)
VPDIRDRTALVTGAGQGIGAAIAVRLAEKGARVACNDIIDDAAAATADRVGGIAAAFDVADPEAVSSGLRRVTDSLGPIDILVANHAYMTMASVLQERRQDRDRALEVNLLGTAWLIGGVASGMQARGWGRVVAIASEWGIIGWPGAASYAASKGGIISLVRSAAVALAPHGVAVNAVAPGVTDTPQLDVDAQHLGLSHEAMVARYAEDIPLGRVGRVEDVASTVAFLCSEAAIAFVGQVVQPNGGTTRAR